MTNIEVDRSYNIINKEADYFEEYINKEDSIDVEILLREMIWRAIRPCVKESKSTGRIYTYASRNNIENRIFLKERLQKTMVELRDRGCLEAYIKKTNTPLSIKDKCIWSGCYTIDKNYDDPTGLNIIIHPDRYFHGVANGSIIL